MANETFISYSRANSHFAIRLEQALRQFGIDPWIDWEDIAPIATWREEILIAIQACANFIFILSPQSISSKECLAELNQALRLDKRLIPIVAEAVRAQDVPLALREFNWIFFNGGFNEGLAKLCQVLDSDSSVSFEQLNNKIVLSTAENQREFILQRKSYLLGRNPGGTVQEFGLIFISSDPFCSRTTATLVREKDRWHIADGFYLKQEDKLIDYKESRNGLKLNEGNLTRFLKRRTLYPLTNNCEVIMSPLTKLKYIELHPPDKPKHELGDDKPTLGQED